MISAKTPALSGRWRLFGGALLAAVILGAAPALAHEAKLVVDGQTFHMETLGETGPAVVFEAGQGTDAGTWRSVAAPIAKFARVVLYDRAGSGGSVPIAKPAPVSAGRVATDLKALLAAAHIPPPYVLVGHSLGGLYVQMFARRYPDEVSGVVLLDAASPDAPDELTTRAQLTPGTAAYFEEAGVAESNRQVKSAGRFPDIPLVAIAATDHGRSFARWEPTLMRLQRELAALSPKGTLIVAQGSGHDIQTERPQMVIDAVRRLVDQMKKP